MPEDAADRRATKQTQKTFGNTHVFRPEWADSNDINRWLRREMFVGEVLNFPCGESVLGDVRADVDDAVQPDVVADLQAPPFAPRSFDTIYCDPPYSYHAYDKNDWVLDLWDMTDKRLILQTKNQKYSFSDAKRTVYLAEQAGGGIAYQIFQVFDRPDASLEEFA